MSAAAAPAAAARTTDLALRADTVVVQMAARIDDGAVVATGVASPLAILAIALARATHAPNLTYLACVGAMDPEIARLHRSSEDLAYLDGRRAEITIPELFDHARRNRIDNVFFGAAEVDGEGRTNMTAAGDLRRPKVKLPGIAGASSLRRWVKRPVIVVTRQSKRTLVPRVQVESTSDPARTTTLLTDLAVFELGAPEATLLAVHPWSSRAEVAAKTGFTYREAPDLGATPLAAEPLRRVLGRIDVDNLRFSLFGS
jgi:glutaconate CoA-transferase subunit B